MGYYPRVKCYPAYKHLYPVLHKFGKLRLAKDGTFSRRCKCGFFVYGTYSGLMADEVQAHLSAQK
jgi:hypothetical protein